MFRWKGSKESSEPSLEEEKFGPRVKIMDVGSLKPEPAKENEPSKLAFAPFKPKQEHRPMIGMVLKSPFAVEAPAPTVEPKKQVIIRTSTQAPAVAAEKAEDAEMIEEAEEPKPKRKIGLLWFVLIPLVLLALIAAIVLVWSAGWNWPAVPTPSGPTDPTSPTTVDFPNSKCHVRVSITEQEKELGLRFTKYLEPDGCMLYIFNNPGQYPFWGKDMEYSIDIIFVGPDNRINYIEYNVPGCTGTSCPTYTGPAPYQWVVETNSGFARTNNLTIGQSVKFY